MPEPTPQAQPPQPSQAALVQPIQEEIRFLVAYTNVYVNNRTGELELGARAYRNPAAADDRRRTHPVRGELTFVGVFPLTTVVPDAVRQAVLARVESEARRQREEEERRRVAEEDRQRRERERLERETVAPDQRVDRVDGDEEEQDGP